MARRKHKKAVSRKRRRSSGMGAAGGQMTNLLGIIAGAAVGRIVANKLLPSINSKIKNGAVLALGAFVFPKMIKGAWGSSIGAGMVAAGGIGLLQNFNVVGAIEDTLSIPLTVGEVPENISVIAGNDDSVMAGDISVMAGMDDEDYDY
jgi:hypothetical protein